MLQNRRRYSLLTPLAARLRVAILTALAIALVAAPLAAQRMGRRSSRPTYTRTPWSLMLTGGGAYALSDFEVAPGTDQNGGWAWDAGLRLGRDRASVGVGFERTRYAVTLTGAAVTSAIYLEPRFALGPRGGAIRPYIFAHGAWIYDYDVDACCSVYRTSQDADGWSYGGGFGLTTPPIGFVRFDVSAGISQLRGESELENLQAWKGAGPVVALRLGASVPLIGGR